MTSLPGDGGLILEKGGAVFDVPARPEALWGDEGDCLWARGEPTMLYSDTGVVKTTLAQQLALAMVRVGDSELLGYPTKQLTGRVLYIASDRPRQARRSLRRMVTEADREDLDDRLIWHTRRQIGVSKDTGPESAKQLLKACKAHDISLVVLDSVKDVVVGSLTEDSSGKAFNDFVQSLIAADVEVLSLHHSRKDDLQKKRGQLALADVYGSTWFTAGQGSVIALDGKSGSGFFTLRQLKQPANQVQPIKAEVDYETGTIRAVGERSTLQLLEERGPLTVRRATELAHPDWDGTKKQEVAMRRQLEGLVGNGKAIKTPDTPATYSIK